MVRFRLAASLSILTLALIAPNEASAQSADEKALASYRLNMATVRKVAAATQAFAAEQAKDPKMQELTKLRAEIKTLEDKDERTDAESEKLEKLREREEALEETMARGEDANETNNSQSLADMETSIKKMPQAVAILAREGITPREYTLCMMALLQAAMVEGFSQGTADLSKLPAGVNPDNVRFVRENKAELEALQKMMAGPKR
jgi:septal ring factor EnvC (AmiA/AmiB activator)